MIKSIWNDLSKSVMKRILLSFNRPVLFPFWSWCFLYLFVAIPSFSAPRIVCDSPKYDFGTVIGQNEITHTFILWNRGDESVKISGIKNCCGTESSITPMEILPGSNAVCTSIFTTRNRYGPQDKQILIASNDRKNPYYELKMIGTLLKSVECSPRLLRLGNLLPDSKIMQTITATNRLEKVVMLESVKTSIRGMSAEVMDGGGDSVRSWTIHLSTSNSLPVGKISGQIRLKFSSGSVNVPVIGTVNPFIQVVPEQVQIVSGLDHPVERLVMLRGGSDRLFDILSAELLHADGQVEILKLAETRWQLKLSISSGTIESGARLKIKTTCEGQTVIEIPIIQ